MVSPGWRRRTLGGISRVLNWVGFLSQESGGVGGGQKLGQAQDVWKAQERGRHPTRRRKESPKELLPPKEELRAGSIGIESMQWC